LDGKVYDDHSATRLFKDDEQDNSDNSN
jgi:hypothetical protein